MFTRNVRDAALLAAVLADRPSLATPENGAQTRFGLYLPPWCAMADPAALAALHHAADRLRRSGYAVMDIGRIDGFDTLLDAQAAVMDWDQVHALLFEFDTGGDRLDPVTRAAIAERSARMSAEKYDAAHAALRLIGASLHERFAKFDALLVPSAPGEAPLGLGSTGSSDFNRGWTALHVPCITVPAGHGPRGLPLGVQIVGRLGADVSALAAALAVESCLAGAPFSNAGGRGA